MDAGIHFCESKTLANVDAASIKWTSASFYDQQRMDAESITRKFGSIYKILQCIPHLRHRPRRPFWSNPKRTLRSISWMYLSDIDHSKTTTKLIPNHWEFIDMRKILCWELETNDAGHYTTSLARSHFLLVQFSSGISFFLYSSNVHGHFHCRGI